MNKKRKLADSAKAISKAAGKFTLKGIQLAGLGLLSATEIASRGADKLIKDPPGRKLATKAALIAACIAFPSVAATMTTVGITSTVLNYVYHNNKEGRKVTALEAIENIIGISDKVLDKTLSLVSVPAHMITKGIGNSARIGKEAINKNTMENEGNPGLEM